MSSGFADDDFEAEEGERERANGEIRRVMAGQQGRYAVRAVQEEALSQDASIYDYDGVYDQIKETAAASRNVVGRPQEQKK